MVHQSSAALQAAGWSLLACSVVLFVVSACCVRYFTRRPRRGAKTATVSCAALGVLMAVIGGVSLAATTLG